MRPTFKKLEVKDIGTLERLVAENVDGIEHGLKVVDSRLLLGQAAIDLVGLDAGGSLALIALDFTADEGLLLRVMDAYSWCLEYPDTLRRLYPMAQSSGSRPPRILFVAERLTDAFLRRIKQLSFLEIDCFEFRHLQVNGESVVYFDHVERLRKSIGEAPKPVAESSVEPLPAAPVVKALEPRVELPVEPRVVPPVVRVESRVAPRVEPPVEPLVTPRVEPPVARVEPPAPCVEAPVELPVAPRVEPPASRVAPRIEPAGPVVAALPVAKPAEVESVRLAPALDLAPSVPVPVAPPALVVGVTPPEMPKPQSVEAVAEPAPALPPAVETPVVQPRVEETAPAARALQLEAIETTASMAPVDLGSNGSSHEASAFADHAAVESHVVENAVPAAPEPVVAAIPEAKEAVIVTPAPAPVATAPVQTPPVWAKPQAQPNGNRPYFFAQATKGPSPVEAQAAAVATTAEPAAPAQAASKAALAVDDRPELESLSFPKDGLSRQWLEFLSQLGATK
jgi:hypothetical protein